ncbi:hypothetical protein WG66_005081, partial [Moniliophthora roreri]
LSLARNTYNSLRVTKLIVNSKCAQYQLGRRIGVRLILLASSASQRVEQ